MKMEKRGFSFSFNQNFDDSTKQTGKWKLENES